MCNSESIIRWRRTLVIFIIGNLPVRFKLLIKLCDGEKRNYFTITGSRNRQRVTILQKISYKCETMVVLWACSLASFGFQFFLDFETSFAIFFLCLSIGVEIQKERYSRGQAGLSLHLHTLYVVVDQRRLQKTEIEITKVSKLFVKSH